MFRGWNAKDGKVMQDGIFSFNKFVFSIVLLYRFIKAMDL